MTQTAAYSIRGRLIPRFTQSAAYSFRGRLEPYLPETESENNGAPVKQLYHDEGQDDIEDVNHGLLP